MHKALAVAAVAAFAGLAGAANASEIYPVGGFKDEPLVALPIWSGWYLGGHVGGAFGSLDINDYNTSVKFGNDSSSFFGGGQFGFLYQRGNLVIGPEVDLGGMGLSHTSTEPGLSTTASRVGSGFYFDLTARLGYAYGPALFYAKGGLAYYDGSLSITDGTASYSTPARNGYTVGAGIEYRVSPSWSLKAEYLYFDFSAQSNLFSLPSEGNSYEFNPTIQTVKVGFNYHIPGGYSPLK
jgi:opacity protein-like surface antigen